MASIYNCKLTVDEDNILEELRQKLAKVCGITLQGNRVTARWTSKDDHLVDVHMIVESISTVKESIETGEKWRRMRKLVKRYPWIEDELYYAEYGYHSQ